VNEFLTMKYKIPILITVLLSVALYVFSLTQKCFYANTEADSLAVLIMGGLGIIAELGNIFSLNFANPVGATFTWLANPLLWLAWFFAFKSPKQALYFSAAATALALAFLLFPKVIGNDPDHYNEVTKYWLGYWLWLGSTVVMTAGLFTYSMTRK